MLTTLNSINICTATIHKLLFCPYNMHTIQPRCVLITWTFCIIILFVTFGWTKLCHYGNGLDSEKISTSFQTISSCKYRKAVHSRLESKKQTLLHAIQYFGHFNSWTVSAGHKLISISYLVIHTSAVYSESTHTLHRYYLLCKQTPKPCHWKHVVFKCTASSTHFESHCAMLIVHH